MAADRVAAGRGRAEKILAFDPATRHRLAPSRRHPQIALAHRARLSGTQAGGWARPLRRAWMAWLPPSRHALHRSLRIPDFRTEYNSPLRSSLRRAVPAIRATPRLPTPRLRPDAPNRAFPNTTHLWPAR